MQLGSGRSGVSRGKCLVESEHCSWSSCLGFYFPWHKI